MLLAYLVGLVVIGLAAPTVIAGWLTLLLSAAWGLKPLPEPPLAWSGRGIQRTIYLPWQPGWTYALPVVRVPCATCPSAARDRLPGWWKPTGSWSPMVGRQPFASTSSSRPARVRQC